MNPVKSLFKVTSFLLLASMLTSCASHDSYRGHVSNTPSPAERDSAIDSFLMKQYGAAGGPLAVALYHSINGKDPVRTPVAAGSEKTKYLEQVASASKEVPKTTSDQNGTAYLAQP